MANILLLHPPLKFVIISKFQTIRYSTKTHEKNLLEMTG